MKKIVLPAILLFAACQRNNSADVESLLKSAMLTHLYEGVNNDSSKIKYEVKEVVYYENNSSYDCEFTVHMKTAKLDTTGIMSANVMKDFKKVVRKS